MNVVSITKLDNYFYGLRLVAFHFMLTFKKTL